MLLSLLVFYFISLVIGFNSYCLNCKFYKAHDINPELSTCQRFKDFIPFNGEKENYKIVNKLAISCRENEDLCGINGNSFQERIVENKQFLDDLENLSHRCCGEVNETDEIEQLERDFFDILQKIKKHNKRQIYNTSKDLYKLFRRVK
jgi:hypothetical protein